LDKYCEKESALEAMLDEYSNLDKRKCWRLNKLPKGQKLANTIMVIRIVRLPSGKKKKMKARIAIAAQNFKPGEDHQVDCFAAAVTVCSVREEINTCVQEDRECKSIDIGQAFTRCKRDRAPCLLAHLLDAIAAIHKTAKSYTTSTARLTTDHKALLDSGLLRSTTSLSAWTSVSAARPSIACTSKSRTGHNFGAVCTSTT
jgi:hypothetical protein